MSSRHICGGSNIIKKMRIVSLVPSITELLFALGLEEEVVGITKFCIHPQKWLLSKTRIGGTKTIHIEQIMLLQPDLIIASKEENVKDQVAQLAAYSEVLLTDVTNFNEAIEMILQVGILTNREHNAEALAATIKTNFASLHPSALQPVVYFIWKDPWMTVGGDTFINSMLLKAGFQNMFAQYNRYPVITPEALIDLNPPKILLSSEPYPFNEKHVPELQQLLPDTTIILTDGALFSWYGSRMLLAPSYFRKLNPLL